jgi:predicted Zn-dependent peptidase
VQNYSLSELETGERVVAEHIPGVRSVAVGFWIGVGSRDETPAKSGITHFIEHLLFKGTRSYTAQDIAEIFDGLGGELNAATSREHTVVYARVPDHHLETAIEVMSDMVFVPTFTDLDSEREVVLEEIAMVEDSPQELVHDLVSEAIFPGHPLGRPVIGREEVISSVSRRTITGYHQAMYGGGNIVVAAAGSVDHEALVKLIQRAASSREETATPANVRRPLVKPPPPSMRFLRKDTEQYHVCIGAPGIARSDRRRFAVSILDAILGGSASSRLFQEIREKRGMAYSVYSFASQYSDSGQIGLYVGTREENLAIAGGNVTAGEIARAKENIKGRIVLSMESTSNRMSRLGKSIISDTEMLSLDRLIAEIDAVEADAVSELASVLLAPDKLSAAGVGASEEHFTAAIQRVSPALAAKAAA